MTRSSAEDSSGLDAGAAGLPGAERIKSPEILRHPESGDVIWIEAAPVAELLARAWNNAQRNGNYDLGADCAVFLGCLGRDSDVPCASPLPSDTPGEG